MRFLLGAAEAGFFPGVVFYLESTGLSEPLPVARPRLGRRTALTFPLFPPPQKN